MCGSGGMDKAFNYIFNNFNSYSFTKVISCQVYFGNFCHLRKYPSLTKSVSFLSQIGSEYPFIIIFISVEFIVMCSFSVLILVFWAFWLLISTKNQVLVSLVFLYYFSDFYIIDCWFYLYYFFSSSSSVFNLLFFWGR